LSFEKSRDRRADPILSQGKATRRAAINRERPAGSAWSKSLCTLRNNLHENRETSRVSRSHWQQGRSAKGTSPTADMHVLEESDRAVLPVNQPNKEGQPPAEVGEGRAWTKGNIVRSHTSPTQSGERVSQGLDGVRQVAKKSKQERFTALLHHMSVGLLRDSFHALQRKAAPGGDGVTWQEYETGLEGRLAELQSRVHRGAYQAQPSRRVYIPKAEGRQRPLGAVRI
jgi:RNA-directed DNA polymerase